MLFRSPLYEHIDLFRNYSPITLNNVGTLGIQPDGTLISSGYVEGYEEALLWKNIVDISCGDLIAGLRADGTVVITQDEDHDMNVVNSWTDVINVEVGSDFTVVLKADGTVDVEGYDAYRKKDVAGWTGIKSISAESGVA